MATFAIALAHQFIQFQTLAIIVLVAVGIVIITLPNKWALRVLFAYLGFEGFGKVISNYHPAVHVGADLLVLALLTKTIVLLILGRLNKDEPLPPLTVLFLLHWFWFLIAFANPYSLGIVASLAGAKVYVTMLLLFFFAYYEIKKNPGELRTLMGIWVAVATIHAVVGLYQFHIGPASVTRIHPRFAQIWSKYGSYAFRPFGLTNLPGLPAIFIFLATPFLFYFFFSAKSLLTRFLLFWLLPLWSVVAFICQIRSALLKSIVAGGVFLIAYLFIATTGRAGKRRVNLLIGLTAVGLAAVLIPYSLDQTEKLLPEADRAFERSLSLFDYEKVSRARRDTWGRIVNYATQVPFGAGLSRTGAASGKFKDAIKDSRDPFGDVFFTDNFWAATIVDLGIPGSLLLSALIFLIFFRGLRFLRRIKDPSEQLIHLALLCGILGSGLGMYGAEAMLYNPEAAYFWFFSGALIALQQRTIEREMNDPQHR